MLFSTAADGCRRRRRQPSEDAEQVQPAATLLLRLAAAAVVARAGRSLGVPLPRVPTKRTDDEHWWRTKARPLLHPSQNFESERLFWCS